MNILTPRTSQTSRNDHPPALPPKDPREPGGFRAEEPMFVIASSELDRLQNRLQAQATTAGILDVAYRTVDTPLGVLLLAATERGLLRVAFAQEGFDEVLATIAARVSPRLLQAPARLDDVSRELDEYFSGTRRRFDVAVDHALSAGFRLQVQTHLPQIAYGETVSYRELAELSGNPRAVRAAGTACATNPLPIVVPCHRVLRSDGGLGGYIGGLEAKTMLLDLERDSSRGTPGSLRGAAHAAERKRS